MLDRQVSPLRHISSSVEISLRSVITHSLLAKPHLTSEA